MATYNRPGVYVEEVLTTSPVPVNTSRTVAAFLGAATKGPIVPTLVNSWSQYVSTYGSWDTTNTSNNTLTQAVKLYFDNGGSSAYIQRAIPTTTSTTTAAYGWTGTTTTTATSNSTTVVLTTAVTGLASGQTVSGPGVPAGTTISTWTSGTKTIVLSAAATIPASSTLTFGTKTIAVATNSLLDSTTANYPISGTGIPAGTTATYSSGTLTLSQAVTSVASGATITFNLSTSSFATLNDQAGTPAATLTLTARYPGAWGNTLYYGISASSLGSAYFNLLVYLGGYADANLVERFTDVTMNSTDNNYVVSVVNGTSGYITATDQNATNAFANTDNPAAVVASGSTGLTNGKDGYTSASPINNTTIAAQVTNFDSVQIPLVLNAPGVTAAADVNTLTTYAGNRGDIFVVIDAQLTPSDVTSQLNLANGYNASAYGAVYYPNLTIQNPQSSVPGATVTAYNGAAVVAKYITTDSSRGVFKSPAGLDVRLSGVVSAYNMTNTELDNLNIGSASGNSGTVFTPVNAIRYIPGSGFVIMGARTLKNGAADKYVSVRRSLIYLRKLLTDLTAFAVFEPNDQRLWNRVKTTCEVNLISFWQQGGLRGTTPQDAFFVKCDSTNNTAGTIANGQVIIEVGVALQRPAEFVVIRISQYDSGSVVTVL